MKIDYTENAIEDLIRQREFIAENDPAAAARYAETLIDGISQLTNQPRLGHAVYYAPEPETIRDLVVGNYIVRYAILDDRILILRIWHHRENWK
jgi:plasmid stabilization system protein ParE